MKIPKVSIPKMNKAEIAEKAKNVYAQGKEFVKSAPGKLRTLATDTVDFAKQNPKKVGSIAGGVIAGAAVLAGAVKLIQAGVEKAQAKKYE